MGNDWEDDYARRQKKKERQGQGCMITLLMGGGILAALSAIAAGIVRAVA